VPLPSIPQFLCRPAFHAMSTKPSRSAELENRMIRFAIDIVKLVANLPNTPEAKHIGTQLLRSGTPAAPNYAEAQPAESRADFIHKLKIALKELNETSTWLRILQGSIAVKADLLSRLVAENAELCRILVASIQTARRNNGTVD